LVKLSHCDIKLINPGAIDTKMIEYLNVSNKMTAEFVAKKITNVMQDPCIKKVDLWL
jgi:hypothetical protein